MCVKHEILHIFIPPTRSTLDQINVIYSEYYLHAAKASFFFKSNNTLHIWKCFTVIDLSIYFKFLFNSYFVIAIEGKSDCYTFSGKASFTLVLKVSIHVHTNTHSKRGREIHLFL